MAKEILTDAQKAKKHLTEDQFKALEETHETLRECLQMLYDCQDLYLSDVRKLDTAYWSLKNQFNLDNSED